MKKILLYGLMKQLGRNADPYRRRKLKKKLFFFAAFAFLGFVFLGGIAVWGAFALVSQVAASVQTDQGKALVKVGQERVQELGSKPIIAQACLDTILGLTLNPTKLLTVPLTTNINSITASCLVEKAPSQPKQEPVKK